MNRMEEYRALAEELEKTPPALEYTLQRTRARAKRHRVRRLFGVPGASIAGVFAAFVLLVNLSTPFALACGRIPLLKELTAAVALSPSLKAAVQNDYVQFIGLTQTDNGVTMTVDYVIVDQKQVIIFYTTESSTGTQFSVNPSVRTPAGEEMEGFSISSGSGENDTLRKFVIDFMDTDVPAGMQLTCALIPWGESDAPVRVGDSQPDYVEPDAAATFTFALHFDPAYIETGEVVPINQWLTLDAQRVLVKDVEIYPTHIRLNLGDDESNSAWLTSLDFFLEDEHGNRFEKMNNGITATGSVDSHFMAGHRLESSYFGDAAHLTVHITGVTWLDKDMEYVNVDLINDTAGALPDWLHLEQVEHLGRNRFELTFTAPCREESHYYQLLRWDYLDEAGQEHSFSGMSTRGMDNNPAYFAEHVILEDYPFDTVRLGLSSTRTVELNTPLKITVK